MPVFQLELSAALGVCALLSAVLLYYFDFRIRHSREEGEIRLPEDGDETLLEGGDDAIVEPYRDEPSVVVEEWETGRMGARGKGKGRQDGDEDGDGDEDELDEKEEKDPFDVTTPMDMVDGRPVDEGKFWAEVRIIQARALGVEPYGYV